MKDYSQILEQMIQKIEEGFSGVVPPAKDNITSCICDECKAVQAVFANKLGDGWRDIDETSIEEHFNCLPILSPEAFHYFLPAYLVYSLKHFYLGNDVCAFTLYALCPGKDWKKSEEWWKNRFKHFSREQIDLIFKVMDLALADDRFDYQHIIIERGKDRLAELLAR